ncbi:MAG TPA: glycosyltransferase family 39 protein [Caulobacteraceae bacterium]|nr:glycosyltransferase family 39 protein [Caulobacteraceae bacterium]
MAGLVSVSGARAPASRAQARWRQAAIGFALTSALAWAFVGLDGRGFWIDELFTRFVVDAQGGLAGVWRRALSDTQPPAYYLLLYGWTQVFGRSETALRSFSAVCASGAIGVWLAGSRGVFSRPARLFAAAVGAVSPFWFLQAQNARNYGLAMLLVSLVGVLAMRAHRADRQADPRLLAWTAALAAAGALAAFVHFYAFLAVGLVSAALLASLRSTPARALLVLAGVAIAAAQAAFMVELMRRTQADFHQLWFRNDIGFLASQALEAAEDLAGPAAAVALAALALARRAVPLNVEARWAAGLGLWVVAATLAIGAAVSLAFAPSLSARNLLVASPLLWPLWAALWEKCEGWIGGVDARALAAAAVALQALTTAERLLPYGEPWRESAQFIDQIPSCRGALTPVLMLRTFGPPTPFYRELTRRDFYGRYAVHLRPLVLDPAEIGDPAANPSLRPGAPCPVLAWAVHGLGRRDAETMTAALARKAGPGGASLRTFMGWRFVWGLPVHARSGFVILRGTPPGQATASPRRGGPIGPGSPILAGPWLTTSPPRL